MDKSWACFYQTSCHEGIDTLWCIDGPKDNSELRHRWFDQISRTLKHLHSQNIVWGDAKTANVLIDFGGCTRG